MKTYSLEVKESLSLNDFLRRNLPGLIGKEISNGKIRRLIISGSVSVNGRLMRIPSFMLKNKSLVTILVDEEKLFYEKQADDIDFEISNKDILYEDEVIIVINKPSHFPSEAGMVKSRDNLHDALVRFLFERQKKESPSMKNPPYVGIMHRLDRDTSGVILFTKSRSVNNACHKMFEDHTARKIYHAIISPEKKSNKNLAETSEFFIDFPMGRISPKGQAAKWGKVPENKGGLNSKTEFKILKKLGENRFLIECRPLTGRTHQIRVHLSSCGLPILGDVLYGGRPFERIMLHALSLNFPHPLTGEYMTVTAPDTFLGLL